MAQPRLPGLEAQQQLPFPMALGAARPHVTGAGRLRLRDPFGGAEVTMSGAALQRDGDVLAGPMAAGQAVVLCLPGETGDLDAAAAAVGTSDTSRLGLR